MLVTFTCKDCEMDFPSAKEFTAHVTDCEPENICLLLTQAIDETSGLFSGPNFGPNSKKLATALLKRFRITRK